MQSPFPVTARLLAAGGALASAGVVLGMTKAGYGDVVDPPAGPFGWWQKAVPLGQGGSDSVVAARWSLLAILSVFAFALCFLGLYRLAGRGALSIRQIVLVAVAWAVPVLLAHPLLSLDAYSYTAQGEMVAHGLDPYRVGPIALGPGRLLDAVAPVWRETPAPYGPLTLAILRWIALVTGGNQIAFVFVLRAVVIAAIGVCGFAAVRLARESRKAVVLALVIANPVTIFHLAGGAHLEALIAACVGLTILAIRADRWWWAAFVAATALALKLPGLVLIAFVLAARVGPRREQRVAGALGIAGIATAAMLAYAELVPHGWGWLEVLNVPGKALLYYAPPTVLAEIVSGLAHLADPALRFTTILAWTRAVCGLAGAIGVALLLLRARTEVRWQRVAVLAGIALAVLAVSGPALHAWYLTWGLIPLAACAGSAGRRWMIAALVAVSFTAMAKPLQHGAGLALTLVLVVTAVAAAVVAARPEPAVETTTEGPVPQPA
ncbi:MAG: alpha,6-mannosyltransferase [Cryptosporangiaceae bacterium]|nr:alpha,6-mannosyltransferase [Cryptosporangiaceae bacterium]